MRKKKMESCKTDGIGGSYFMREDTIMDYEIIMKPLVEALTKRWYSKGIFDRFIQEDRLKENKKTIVQKIIYKYRCLCNRIKRKVMYVYLALFDTDKLEER